MANRGLSILLVSTVACGSSAVTTVPEKDAGSEVVRDGGPTAAPRDAGPAAARDGGTATSRDGGTATSRDGGPPPVRDAGAPVGGNGCGLAPGENNRRWTLEHGGRTREFLVHVPDGYDANVPTPVVFDFHGRLFTATLQLGLTGMRDVADDEGFIVVHAEGVGRTWNGGVCCGEAAMDNVDDVGFVSAMIDELDAALCVDDRRVFATGMSNGGFLSHRLACELSDRIAAIAPVAGVLGIAQCAPSRAVPVFHFHGNDDNIVGYDGIRGYLSVADSMEGWVDRNGCGQASNVYFMQDDVTCEAWTGCNAGAEVRLCTIDGGGHTWPGGTPLPGLGRTTNTIDASSLMWDFFEAHPMP